jgi:ribosomal protein S18 acetylase RimI-like enzyme
VISVVTESYRISLEGAPSAEDERLLDAGLEAYGAQFAPQDVDQPMTVMLRAADGRLVGGLIAQTGWGWLYVRTLWIEEGARRHSYGRELMSIAEKEGLRRGCHSARLSTQSYEALPFYEHLGYQVFGELSDYPLGHKKYFLQKRLALAEL